MLARLGRRHSAAQQCTQQLVGALLMMSWAMEPGEPGRVMEGVKGEIVRQGTDAQPKAVRANSLWGLSIDAP